MSNITAPCGHPGRAVIGTYIECLQGCGSKKPLVIPAPHRGEPGHVTMCACKLCQVRRNGVRLVLRSKDGRDVASVPWDGVAKEVTFSVKEKAIVRHYHLLDRDDQIIASNAIALEMQPESNYICEFDIHEPSSFRLKSTTRGTPVKKREEGMSHAEGWHQVYKEMKGRTLIPYRRGAPTSGTRSDLEAVVACIPGISDFRITFPQPYLVRVELLRLFITADTAILAVREELSRHMTVGIALEVEDLTYDKLLGLAFRRYRHNLNEFKASGGKVTDVAKRDLVLQAVESELLHAKRGVRKVIATTTSNGALHIDLLGSDGENYSARFMNP